MLEEINLVVIWQGSLEVNPSVLIDCFCHKDRFYRNGQFVYLYYFG